MKKTCLFLIYIFTLYSYTYSQRININGISHPIDTLVYSHNIGPGTKYASYQIPDLPLQFYVLEINLSNPYVGIETCLSKDSAVATEQPTQMGKRKNYPGHKVLGATNGDFYFYQDLVETGIPRSGQFLYNECITNPVGRASFVLSPEKKAYIDRVDFQGKLIKGSLEERIHTVNMQRLEAEPNASANMLTLYTSAYGTVTSGITGGYKVIIRPKDGKSFFFSANKYIPCIVDSVFENSGSNRIPKGWAVLHGRGEAADFLRTLKAKDEFQILLNVNLRSNPGLLTDFAQQVGGSDNIILKNGQRAEGDDILNPRTGMGISEDGNTVYMIVVDGRQAGSIGIGMRDFGDIFRAVGAWNASNLDGGGSSAMVALEQLVNKPSGGSVRAVGNGVLVISTAPTENTITNITPYKSFVSLPTYGQYIPKFYAYNQYGELIESDLQGIVLSCPKSLGTIDGNKFIATGNSSGNIMATYNGNIITTIAVNIVSVSDIKIRLDSVIVDNRSDYPIEVVGTTASGESTISPGALSWTVVNDEICKIEDGALIALKNGTTKIIGQIGNISDTLLVNVEIPESSTIIGDSLKINQWEISASSFLNATLDENNLPENWGLGAAANFIHSSGRSPFIKLTNQKQFYGLPDTIKLVLNIGDMNISRAIISLRANNETTSQSIELNSFKQNQDFTLDIPVNQLFDNTDRAIYPIWFDNVYFYLNASGMTASQAYTLAFKDILLVYDGLISTEVSLLRTNNFCIFPNPIKNGILNLQLKENNAQKVKTEIYNTFGQLVNKKEFGKYNGELLNIPVNTLASGTYILKVYQNHEYQATKFIIK